MATSKQASRADLFVRFLQLSAAIRDLPTLDALDPLEERIVTWLAVANAQGERPCVRRVMEHREFGAPATIHTRLKEMRRKGWIALGDTEDVRRKQVELTASAHRYFQRLGTCMLKAVRA